MVIARSENRERGPRRAAARVCEDLAVNAQESHGVTLHRFCRRALVLVLMVLLVGGCTAPSLRLALNAQQRADEVQQFVFQRQHEGLRIMLHRDLLHRLEQDDATLNAAQREALNEAWNERDLLEFWALQFERAKALRLAGVDAKLYADQSPVDLIIKSLDRRFERIKDGWATALGEQVGASADNATSDANSDGEE